MKTVQMTLDDELVDAVDKVVKKLKTTRSAFTRQALREAINQVKFNKVEMKHKRGYERNPVKKLELCVWESEQEWGH
ncbi:MAG TPA: ribbon-helix-helix domain-containing protein [Nitrospinota bacterium]|nr:ribbon-helix-helix domain-containing protein [Nitrospinota bacterium]